jgi:hypothetical protein
MSRAIVVTVCISFSESLVVVSKILRGADGCPAAHTRTQLPSGFPMRSHRVLRMPDVRARLAELLLEPVGNTPHENAGDNAQGRERSAPVVTAVEIMAMDRPRHQGRRKSSALVADLPAQQS